MDNNMWWSIWITYEDGAKWEDIVPKLKEAGLQYLDYATDTGIMGVVKDKSIRDKITQIHGVQKALFIDEKKS